LYSIINPNVEKADIFAMLRRFLRVSADIFLKKSLWPWQLNNYSTIIALTVEDTFNYKAKKA